MKRQKYGGHSYSKSVSVGGIIADKLSSDGTNKKKADPWFNPVTSLPANSIVAHLKEGIEVIHLYTGRTLCKLHLASGGLHVDLNGDGVLDHIKAEGGYESRMQKDQRNHVMRHKCSAYVTSGIPPKEELFNGTICKTSLLPMVPKAFDISKDGSSPIIEVLINS